MTDGEGEEAGAVRDWELIKRVVVDVNQRILANVAVGSFHEPSFGVLSALLHAPERRLPMSRLAREVAMTSGGFTRLADRLGTDGLIDRRGSDLDRRVIYASLTPAGLREARRLERRYQAALRDEVLAVLSPQQLHAMAETLRALDLGDGADADARPQPVAARRRATDKG